MSGDSASPRKPWKVPTWAGYLLLLVVVVLHLIFATRRWHSAALVDHEFRQTQTAVITRYIDEQNNFSIDYETPILGKPWQIPLEFPFYQWTVVGISRLLAQPHVPVARGVSLVSFYLTLAAVWVLLGAMRLRPAQRCWILAFVLVSPVYLFYSRSFLIDPFATMASAWFLAAFERSLATRRLSWALLATTAAIVGALVKSVVFFVWMVPAALWGAWVLGQEIWQRAGIRQVGATLAWGLLPVLPALALLKWWIGHTDAIKAVHPSGWIFTSENLSVGNFGSFSLATRFSFETWNTLFERWREAMIGPGWVLAFLVLALLGTQRHRIPALICTGLFLVGQLAFPNAYALQDYYFYAGAIFLSMALGFHALGWLEAPRWHRMVGVVLALLPMGLLGHSYHRFYYQHLMADDSRDWAVTKVFRELLPPDAVIVVAGNDWSAVTTYQSQRRTLMIRNGLEHDGAYLTRAFSDLEDEQVGALMLLEATRENDQLRTFAVTTFGLGPDPSFTEARSDIYLARSVRDKVLAGIMAERDKFGGVHVPSFEPLPPEPAPVPPTVVSVGESPEKFPLLHGWLVQYRSPHVPFNGAESGRPIMGLHPPLELWIDPPERTGRLHWQVGLQVATYEGKKPWEGTDGVGFSVFRETVNGDRERLSWTYLNPIGRVGDQGPQAISVDYALQPGDRLVLTTMAGFNDAFDWAYMSEFRLEPKDE
jgi:hypothetical protein